MRTFQEKKAMKLVFAIGMGKAVIKGKHWVAGLEPLPNSGRGYYIRTFFLAPNPTEKYTNIK